MHRVLFGLLWLVLLCLPTLSATAEKRVALVIGNSDYAHTAKLNNPGNDAADIAGALRTLGFTVIEGADLDKATMDRRIRDFARALPEADVGLFFYAGHGLQVGAQNYLVPTDAKLDDAAGLDFEMVRLDLVQRTMEREAKTNLLFLDACRDNPLARNLARAMGTRSGAIGRGLAQIEAGIGTLISFSTQPGSVAADGDGRNSPYAGALRKQLRDPREDLSTILIGVRNDVMAKTANRQVPWEHSALRARFYFEVPIAPTGKPGNVTSSFEQQAELAFWATVKDSRNIELIQSYVHRFPGGVFATPARILVEHLRREQGKVVHETIGETGVEGGTRHSAEKPTTTAALSLPVASSGEQSDGIATTALIRNIQKELHRVGCDPGQEDGTWGPRLRQAAKRFVRSSKLALAIDRPTEELREAIVKTPLRVCPLICRDGETNVDGKCRVKARESPPVIAAKAKPTAKGSAPGQGGNCLATYSGSHCVDGEGRVCLKLVQGQYRCQ